MARVYLLLYVSDRSADHVVRSLRCKPGVVFTDLLEGPPDVIIMAEADDRLKLAKLATRAIASVESSVEVIRVLPASDGLNP